MGLEIERKFRIGTEAAVPDVAAVASLGEQRTHELRAVYYDTPDLVLARNRRTLRRRTGGHDAGWHLKLPAGGDAREEICHPLSEGSGAMAVPAEFRAQVADLIGYAPLIPVVELATTRHETDLHTPGEQRWFGVICDDTVTATRRGKERTWRELEIEIADPEDVGLLDVLTQALAEAGVTPSPAVSKLVQGLGKAVAKAERRPGLSRKSSAAEIVGAYVAAQVGVIQAREADVRADAPDAVHKMRVAVRRLRSALHSFRPFLDPDQVDSLRGELQWLGAALGGPRDAEVLQERLNAAVTVLEPDLVVGPVQERVRAELGTRHAEAHAALLEALDSDRAHNLSAALVTLVNDPPFGPEAGARATGLLPERLDQLARRAAKAWRRADRLTGNEQRAAWHETRKRAKAARYAWEAATPALGDRAVVATAAWENVTETLGAVQDTHVAQAVLLEIAEQAQGAGEPGFTYGVLYQREAERITGFSQTAAAAMKRALKSG